MYPTKVRDHAWTFVCTTLGWTDDLLSSVLLLDSIFNSFDLSLVGGNPRKLWSGLVYDVGIGNIKMYIRQHIISGVLS